MQKKIFLKVGFLSGIIPLLGGLIIFFSWVIYRNYFGIDLRIMTSAGFYWILISIPFALIGMLLLILFIIKNKKQYLKRSIICMILILINIPIADIILKKVDEISDRAYLKIYNQTKQNNIHIVFKGAYYYKDLGELNNGDYKVVYFRPEYSNLSLEIEGIVDSFFLEIKSKNEFKKLLCPAIYQGDFFKLKLSEVFQITDSK